jgi:hypothetical protein
MSRPWPPRLNEARDVLPNPLSLSATAEPFGAVSNSTRCPGFSHKGLSCEDKMADQERYDTRHCNARTAATLFGFFRLLRLGKILFRGSQNIQTRGSVYLT